MSEVANTMQVNEHNDQYKHDAYESFIQDGDETVEFPNASIKKDHRDITKAVFNDDVLIIISHKGLPYIAINPITTALGVQFQGQLGKLQRKFAGFLETFEVTDPSLGVNKKVLSIELNKLDLWLFSFTRISKLSDYSKVKLGLYKTSCVDFLTKLWRSSDEQGQVLQFEKTTNGGIRDNTTNTEQQASSITNLPVLYGEFGELHTTNYEETNKSLSSIASDIAELKSAVKELNTALTEMRLENLEFQTNVTRALFSIENQLKQINAHQQYSIYSFADMHGISPTDSEIARISWNCNLIASKRQSDVSTIVDSKYGIVNVYDLSVLVDGFSLVYPRFLANSCIDKLLIRNGKY